MQSLWGQIKKLHKEETHEEEEKAKARAFAAANNVSFFFCENILLDVCERVLVISNMSFLFASVDLHMFFWFYVIKP